MLKKCMISQKVDHCVIATKKKKRFLNMSKSIYRYNYDHILSDRMVFL